MTDTPASESHQLDPVHLPTPFTAAQIRAASPSGKVVETATELADGTVTRERVEFLDCDDAGTMMRATPVDESGEPNGASREGRSSWTELQSHASFPAAVATRSSERIETPLGELDCLRYDVDAGDRTMTFWFAEVHPGMPIRFTAATGDRVESTTTVVRIAAVPSGA